MGGGDWGGGEGKIGKHLFVFCVGEYPSIVVSINYCPLQLTFFPRFSRSSSFRADVQPKSSIPIGGKVEISPQNRALHYESRLK
jgi:hypothetical protein